MASPTSPIGAGRTHEWPEVDISGLDHLKRWIDLIAARPAVQKGVATPPGADPEQQVKSARSILA